MSAYTPAILQLQKKHIM